jgi:hypothetical protein
MILRFGTAVALVLALAGAAAPAFGAEARMSVPEAMLRAKPGVVLIIAEVSAEVTADCGSGPTTVSPR